jgi:hypothetical protein
MGGWPFHSTEIEIRSTIFRVTFFCRRS